MRHELGEDKSMSRRDTIIIAILVNAGILLVLFAIAMPSKEDKQAIQVVQAQVEAKSEVGETTLASADTALDSSKVVVDEIDQVLSEWNEQNQNASVLATAAEAQTTAAAVYPLAEETATVEETVVAKSDKVTEVVVKKGDALDKIARAHGTTADEIMALNHLASTKLQIGQVLKVPGEGKAKSSSKAKSATKKSSKKAAATAGEYVVKSGENPWTIASKNHMTVDELLKLNDLNQDSAKKLRPGDKLKIK